MLSTRICRNLAMRQCCLLLKWARREKIAPLICFIAIEFCMKELRRPSNSSMRTNKTFRQALHLYSHLMIGKCVSLNNLIKLRPKYSIYIISALITRRWFISSVLHKISRLIYRFQKVRTHLWEDLIIQTMRVPQQTTWKNALTEMGTTGWTRAKWCFSLLLRVCWTVISLNKHSPEVSNQALISKICTRRTCPSSLTQTSATLNLWQVQTQEAALTLITRVRWCQNPWLGMLLIRISLINIWGNTNSQSPTCRIQDIQYKGAKLEETSGLLPVRSFVIIFLQHRLRLRLVIKRAVLT